MSPILFRAGVLESDAASIAAGTVRLSFSSELPVLRKDKRGKYQEVLSHAPGDVNLGLLNRNGVVLEDHDETREIGDVVKNSAKVDADKKTRADIHITDDYWLARIKTSPGTIPVSVGYIQLSVLSEEAGPDGVQVRKYSWRPYEISLLHGEPADPTVGINRAKKRLCPDCDGEGGLDDGDEPCEGCRGRGYIVTARKRPEVDSLKTADAKVIADNLTPEQKNQMRILLSPAAAEGETKIDVVEECGKAVTSERARINEISALADTHIKDSGDKNDGKMRDEIAAMAREAIQRGDSIDAFRLASWQHVAKATPAKLISKDDVMERKDQKRYSFGAALKNAVKQREKGAAGIPAEDTLEGEVHKNMVELGRKAPGGLGFEPAGFLVPYDVDVNNRPLSAAAARSMGRDMQATIFGQGGAFVPTQLVTPIIELLRNWSVLDKVGVRTMAGLTGNIVIPRQTGAATAYSVSEIGALTTSNQTLDQIALSPKRLGVTQTYSKQFVMQSSPDAEAFLRDDMFQVAALKKDYLGINGQGAASEPLGIMQTPGIGAVTFGATPTYIKMVLFETNIRNANVTGEIAYVSTTATRGSLKTVAEALTGATTIGGRQNAIWQGTILEGTVNYCRALASNQIPNNQVIAGDFSQCISAMWGGLDVVVDYYTKAINAEVVITLNMWIDYALRHPQAFCVSTDAGNQ